MEQRRLVQAGALMLLIQAGVCVSVDDVQSLRLVGGSDECEGRVEVKIRGQWSTVCDDGWDERNTKVVCRQLGCTHSPGNGVRVSSFGAGAGNTWLTGVSCTGEEASLEDCKHYIEEGNICDHKNDVGIVCAGEHEELRLVGGHTECEGRVEVKHRGEWGTVCGLNWYRRNAAVVCRQLGCNVTGDGQVQAALFGAGSGRIWLSHVKCTGDELALWDCEHRMWGSHQCKHRDDAGVICSGELPELRLVGGAEKCEGRLEVRHQGEWGTVCGESWNEDNARVVCRHLGCETSSGGDMQIKATSFGPGADRIWFSDVTCTGKEPTLWECHHQMWGNPFCGHKQDVGVICAGEPEELKLIGGKDACEGRVMVKHRGEWGTVCGYNWGVKEVAVVCRQLGCGHSRKGVGEARAVSFGAGSGQIWLSHVRCTGGESALWECDHRMWGVDSCGHRNDVGVMCGDGNTGHSRDVRIVNGSQHCSGRVEILSAGTWAAVCGAHWDLHVANVLCRQLHCGVAVSVPDGGYFGATGNIWTDEFHCKGTESVLQECSKRALGESKCPHWNTAGVLCSGAAESLRLVDGPSHCEGRLEVRHDSAWGRVVDPQWDIRGAEVVCRELHCGDAMDAFTLKGPAGGAVVWTRLRCHGNETHLEDCVKSHRNSSDVSTDTGEEAGVTCSEGSSVRLVDSLGRCSGTPQIYYRGEWVMISGDSWDKADADVVCRQLKCGPAINVTSTIPPSNSSLWSHEFKCTGKEKTLWECPSALRQHSPSPEHPGSARLECSDCADQCEGRV